MTADQVRPWWVPSLRGSALLATGLWCILRGLSFLRPNVNPAPLDLFNQPVFLVLSTTTWVAVGLFCLISLTRRKWIVAFTIAAVVHGMWAISGFAAWALGADAGWVTAGRDVQTVIVLIAVSAMVDPPRRRHLRRVQ